MDAYRVMPTGSAPRSAVQDEHESPAANELRSCTAAQPPRGVRPIATALMLVATLTLATTIVLPVAPAFGSNLGFLRKSAIARFQESDFALLIEAADAALADPEPGAVRTWTNERTRNSGEVRVLTTFTAADGRTCKRLRVTTRGGDRAGASRHTVCRTPDTEWRLDSRAQP